MGPDQILSLILPDGTQVRLAPGPRPVLAEGTLAEGDMVRFVLEGPEIPRYRVRLLVNDGELDRSIESDTRISWSWRIGFHAGHADVELTGLGRPALRLTLITDPARDKLTRADYVRMVEDVHADTLAILALAGHRVSMKRGDREPPGIAKLTWLSRRMRDLETVLSELDARPWERRTGLQVRQRLGDLRRGIGSRDLSRALHRATPVPAEALDSLPGPIRELALRANGSLPRVVGVRHSSPTNDIPEHPPMLGALHQWMAFAARTRRALAASEKPSATKGRLESACRSIERSLRRSMDLGLFQGVEPDRRPVRGGHIFRRLRTYRRFHQLYQRIEQGVAALDWDKGDVPLSRTFDLYEDWVFLRLLRAAAESGDGPGKLPVVEKPQSGGLTVSLRHTPFTYRGVQLHSQRSFTSVWGNATGAPGSFTTTMKPDIAIEGPHRSDGTVPLVVVDAKYRAVTREGTNGAVTETHKYRDALLTTPHGGGLLSAERAVQAAYVVLPRAPVGPAAQDWKQEERPHVYYRREYRTTFKLGAVALSPGISVAGCRAFLDEVVGHLTLNR